MKRRTLILLCVLPFVALIAEPGIPTQRAGLYMESEALKPAYRFNDPPSLALEGWGNARYASLNYSSESETDIYWPAQTFDHPLPVILCVFNYTTPVFVESNAKPYRKWVPSIIWMAQLANLGFVAICPDVQSVGKDMASMLAWIQEKGPRLGADPSRIGLIGYSANPKIIPYMLSLPQSSSIKAIALYYPELVLSSWPKLNPDVAIHVVKAGKDMTARNTRIDLFAKKYLDAGNYVELITYDNGDHSFDLLDRSAGAAAAMQTTFDFFVQHLK